VSVKSLRRRGATRVLRAQSIRTSCDEFLGLIFAIDELSKLSDIKASIDDLISGSGQLLAMLNSSQKTMLTEVAEDFADTLKALITAAKTNSETSTMIRRSATVAAS
jgi:hypothetical protein